MYFLMKIAYVNIFASGTSIVPALVKRMFVCFPNCVYFPLPFMK